jgi:hypothetical protein
MKIKNCKAHLQTLYTNQPILPSAHFNVRYGQLQTANRLKYFFAKKKLGGGGGETVIRIIFQSIVSLY